MNKKKKENRAGFVFCKECRFFKVVSRIAMYRIIGKCMIHKYWKYSNDFACKDGEKRDGKRKNKGMDRRI